MALTVRDLIAQLDIIEDKDKIVFISGLSYYGDFYNVTSNKLEVIEEDESVIIEGSET